MMESGSHGERPLSDGRKESSPGPLDWETLMEAAAQNPAISKAGEIDPDVIRDAALADTAEDYRLRPGEIRLQAPREKLSQPPTVDLTELENDQEEAERTEDNNGI